MSKYRGLGKGLSALIGENTYELSEEELREIELDQIEPNPEQPRTNYTEVELEELTQSIKSKGVLQPIILKSLDNGKYQIVAGERRWRAAKRANLIKIPAIVKNYDSYETFEIALIENIQRENLTPLEEAEAYSKLIKHHGYTQEKMSSIVHKSRSHITNLLRLLTLPEQIKTYLNKGVLSLGHVKLLINEPNKLEIAERIIQDSLSVRDSEELINELNSTPKKTKKTLRNSKQDEDLIIIERTLIGKLGLEVKINSKSKQAGQITIYYDNLHEFDEIVRKLTNSIG